MSITDLIRRTTGNRVVNDVIAKMLHRSTAEETDLERFIRAIDKATQFSAAERGSLKRSAQRLYDRRNPDGSVIIDSATRGLRDQFIRNFLRWK